MAIKASFPNGKHTITVNGLYQWDHDQVLEIEAIDLPLVVEVHFAYQGLNEAIVRPCSVNGGIGTVTIPNLCLEQSLPVTAWIYEINGTLGRTIKTVTLPIIARARPGVHTTEPDEPIDKYTELITEVNEAVAELTKGNVSVARAGVATNATYAAEAGHASTATIADSVKNATLADKAKTLDYDGCVFGRKKIWSGTVSVNTSGTITTNVDIRNKYLVFDITVGGNRQMRTAPVYFTANLTTTTLSCVIPLIDGASMTVMIERANLAVKSIYITSTTAIVVNKIYEEL